MTNPEMLAREYRAIWNDPDAVSRDQRLADTWTPSARYTDPIMASEGRAGIAAKIVGVRAQFPRHSFTLRGSPDGHGLFVRFSWTLSDDKGAPIAGANDIVRTTQDCQIDEVVGFMDKEFA